MSWAMLVATPFTSSPRLPSSVGVPDAFQRTAYSPLLMPETYLFASPAMIPNAFTAEAPAPVLPSAVVPRFPNSLTAPEASHRTARDPFSTLETYLRLQPTAMPFTSLTPEPSDPVLAVPSLAISTNAPDFSQRTAREPWLPPTPGPYLPSVSTTPPLK